MNTTCKHSNRLHLLKDGELSAEQSRSMTEHLGDCPVCQAEWQSLQSLSTLLGGLEDMDVPPDYDRNFWKKVDHYQSKRLWNFFDGWSGRGWRMAVASPLLVAMIFGAGLYLSIRNFGPGTDEISLSEQMDLLEDFDVVNNLDLLENWDVINQMKEDS